MGGIITKNIADFLESQSIFFYIYFCRHLQTTTRCGSLLPMVNPNPAITRAVQVPSTRMETMVYTKSKKPTTPTLELNLNSVTSVYLQSIPSVAALR